MATAKKTQQKLIKKKETELIGIPNRHQENFNENFVRAAGSDNPKAPKSLNHFRSVTEADTYFNSFLGALVDFIEYFHNNGGAVVGAVNILTHPVILDTLSRGDSSLVVDKFVIGRERLNKLNLLGCAFRRNEFPGNILPHLRLKEKLSGLPMDNGIVDGFRNMGILKVSHSRKENELRALMHHKFMVGLLLDGKGNLSPEGIVTGSANWTTNCQNSFEDVRIAYEAKEEASHLFNRWGFLYSLSEPMVNPNISATPEFRWEPTKVKYDKVAKCPNCGNTRLVSRWYTNDYGKNVQGIWCRECKDFVYLNRYLLGTGMVYTIIPVFLPTQFSH